jgi:hypothetical protein
MGTSRHKIKPILPLLSFQEHWLYPEAHSILRMVLRYTHLLDEHKLNALDRLNSFGIK